MKDLRESIINFFAKYVLFNLAKIFQKKSTEDITIKELYKLPKNTLGYKLAENMNQQNFEFIKGFESHDFKHLLYDYKTDVLGEIRLVYFEYFAGNRSLTTYLVLIFGIILMPDSWKYIKIEKEKAKLYRPVYEINFYKMIHFDFELAKVIVRK